MLWMALRQWLLQGWQMEEDYQDQEGDICKAVNIRLFIHLTNVYWPPAMCQVVFQVLGIQ